VGYSDETFALLPPKPDTPIGKRGVFTLLGAALSGTIARSPEMVFDVHGGITFSGELKHELLQEKLGKFDPWWFGYDCAHAGDAASPEYYERMRQEHPTRPFMWEPVVGGVHRDLDYCINECESLASQIRTLTAPRWRAWLRRVWAAVRRT
jgi:hypothetical protein